MPLQPNGVLSVVLCVRRKDIIMKRAEMNTNTGAKAIDIIKKYTEGVIVRMSSLYPDCVGGQEYCLLNKGIYAEMLKFEAQDHVPGIVILPLDSTPTVIIDFTDFYPASGNESREAFREVSREEYNLLMALKLPYVVEYRDCGTSYKVVVKTKDFYPFLCSEKEYTELDGKTYETLMSFKTVSNF